ncbi:putative low-specificity L-threonine aldolase [Grifola frondosa]|uniref:Putative low-specificity L-threonine aldolase n=1 Tax=Grifola frondosa TaxID=5627 RepID=A0A1C7MX45_GRIFR|nr:putative low-specificity L-threonine aldolase [Grifola frondosa]
MSRFPRFFSVLQQRPRHLLDHSLSQGRRYLMAASIESARAKIAEDIKIDIFTATQVADNAKALKEISRSFIFPTAEMYAYAIRASLGDDVYYEPSTKALEAHMAKITGKEAALFVPSGTMSNQLALRTHLKQPPYSVLCDHRAHIARSSSHSGRCPGTHRFRAPTQVVELENTLNGTIIPQEDVIVISDYVHSKGLIMHLDGARIWDVVAQTATPLHELCAPFDSVRLSDSCLVGPKEFITKARWFRKLFGGGMRQIGVLSASAAYALSHNFQLLPAVHALAKRLETGLEEIGVEITSAAETCMVFFDPSPIGVTYAELVDRASKLPEPIKLGGSRLVIHIQTSPAAVEDFLTLVRQLADEKKQAGFVPPERKASPNGRPYSSIYVRSGVKA